MDRKEEFTGLLQTFLRLGNRLSDHGNRTHDYGTDVLIYPSEIHTIEAIGPASRINVTELASSLGITKGAVSQMIGKLEKKGLVCRSSDRNDKKTVMIQLTEKGKTAWRNHALFHAKQYSFLLDYLNKLSDREMETVKGLFEAMEESFGK